MTDKIDPDVRYKIESAEHAVTFVQSGMKVGLGTGSTAVWATRKIAKLIADGVLSDITGFATSRATAEEARHLGIVLMGDELPTDLDLTIDGADEVDPRLDVIKGGGGALLREKIVAQVSRRYIIVVDETKSSPALGTRFALPVEVLAFGWQSQRRFLESLGAKVYLRLNTDRTPYKTDSDNIILDCRFGPIASPKELANRLSWRAGIIEHGLFLDMVTDVIIGGSSGIRHLKRGP
ncbi:MAG: ribose-5-phosphate isomerase RpiA [Chloroflexi bacterium]|nr:ribose-5-phosphate isomerase RpiA [Chloroflexota bacterium]MCL5273721.1 ribose-5-phosphate isomerase RpiA [Chloroflexota bacterium]